MQTQRGGSFAPPLTAESLAAYRALAAAAPPQVGEVMGKLLLLADEYARHPTAVAATDVRAHPSGRGLVVPLAVAVVDALDPLVPWDEELVMFGEVLDRIDPAKDAPLRDAAYHLLWYAKELSLGREPMTLDKV